MELTKQVSEVIDIDVHRSFNLLTEIPQDTLKKILKSYAVVSESFDYTQGMNFMAGFLFMTLDK